jgi:hypothetical protein
VPTDHGARYESGRATVNDRTTEHDGPIPPEILDETTTYRLAIGALNRRFGRYGGCGGNSGGVSDALAGNAFGDGVAVVIERDEALDGVGLLEHRHGHMQDRGVQIRGVGAGLAGVRSWT